MLQHNFKSQFCFLELIFKYQPMMGKYLTLSIVQQL